MVQQGVRVLPDSIRMAMPGDAAAVSALVMAAYAPWVPIIGAEPGPMRDDYTAAIAAGQVSVLDRGHGIEAVLVLIPQPDALLLDNIAVAAEAQGRGHGKRLMLWAEDQARASHLPKMRLYTHEKMASNIALYTRAGYRETARVTERGLNRVYMEKTLGRSDP